MPWAGMNDAFGVSEAYPELTSGLLGRNPYCAFLRDVAAYFLDTSLRSGSKWGMLVLIVKTLPGSACGLRGNAYA